MKNLLSLQQLFENKLFKIPNYQRGYSWELEQINDLLEDLEEISGQRIHYTGTIVIKANEKESKIKGYGETFSNYDLVDGQQRLTTLVMLINTIVKELTLFKKQESNEIVETLTKRYIRSKGLQSIIYKLKMK